MEVYLSSSYGIILFVWGVIFELAGILAFIGIYNAVKDDQRRMNDVAAEATRARGVAVPAEPSVAAPRPAEPARHPRRAA